jgi:hypothetical protein
MFIVPGCGDASGPAVDLTGNWKFRTLGDQDGYIQGSMKVGRDDSGLTTCKITVYMSEFGSAVEACRIDATEDRIVITTEVISNSAGTWRPETFELVQEEDKLIGTLTKIATYPVEFTKRSP